MKTVQVHLIIGTTLSHNIYEGGKLMNYHEENEYKSVCITLSHYIYEGWKLFSLSTDHELSRGESNPKLLELSMINGCYILPTSHRL